MKGKKNANTRKMSKIGSKSNVNMKAKNRNKNKKQEQETTAMQSDDSFPLTKKEQNLERRKFLHNNVNQPRNMNLKLQDFLTNVEQRTSDYQNKVQWEDEEKATFTDKSAKAYYKEFKKVVDAAHVILQVLDARDPQGTRCLVMEDLVKTHRDKRLVLILNKADLIPRSNLEEWLKYLKNFYPTLLFKASTQNQTNNIAQISRRALTDPNVFQTSKCVGADTLMQLLKNYSRNNGMKTAIVVGVVGMPNVGKSSLINSLKRSKSCNVGATPGVTKTLQEIILDSKVRLLDCPGVIFPGANASDAASSLRNALRIEDLADFITPIEAILEKAGPENLRHYYDLEAFSTVEQFLARFACQRNKIGKGGIPNINAAARTILRDWNTGKIKYFTVPPKDAFQGEATLVSSLTKEFQLEDLDTLNIVDMDDIQEADSTTSRFKRKLVSSAAILPVNIQVELQKDEAMDEEEPERKARWETERSQLDLSKVNMKKLQAKLMKKNRKESNRNVRRTDDLADAFENLF